MPATNQLPKISGLVERIAPLGRKLRGMPIEHDQWNAIVDVLQGLLEIDRAQEETAQSSLEDRFALKTHEHLGQITAAWLDPSLQAALSGTNGGVSVRTALDEAIRKVDALGSEVARLTTRVQEQQTIIDRFSVSDVDRSKTLRDFDARFAGVENLRTLVTTVNSQVEGIRANVNTVLDLRKSLSDPAGNPIDVGKIRQDVAALQTLSENFKGVDGKPVRLLDVTLKLKELSDATGVGGAGGLDGRLANLSNGIETRVNSRVDDRTTAVRAELLQANAAVAEKTKSELQANLEGKLQIIDQASTSGISAAETRLNKSLADQLTAGLVAARTDIVAGATALLNQRLAAVPEQIRAGIVAARPEIESGLRASLTATLSAGVDAQIAAVEGRLNVRVSAGETRANAFQDQLQTKTQADIADGLGRLGTTMVRNLDTQLAQTRTAIEAGFDTRFRSSADALGAGLDAKVSAGIDQRLSNFDARIDQAVTTATRTIPDQISSTVKLELASVDVAAQIQRSAAGVTSQLRGELTQAIADQQVRMTNAVSGSISQLRGELATSVKAGSDNAVERAGALVAGLRDETNRTVTAGLNQVRTELKGALATEITRVSSNFQGEISRVDTRINTRIVRPNG